MTIVDPRTRFWAKVKVAGPDECWLYTGTILAGGYGQFSMGRFIRVMAHRFAYETMVGVIPDGLQLDHLCRERSCVNPRHLEPVTSRENTRRGFTARRLVADSLPGVTLTAKQVREIRARFQPGRRVRGVSGSVSNRRELAAIYGVEASYISRVARLQVRRDVAP